jgi:hypothetical protein
MGGGRLFQNIYSLKTKINADILCALAKAVFWERH